MAACLAAVCGLVGSLDLRSRSQAAKSTSIFIGVISDGSAPTLLLNTSIYLFNNAIIALFSLSVPWTSNLISSGILSPALSGSCKYVIILR